MWPADGREQAIHLCAVTKQPLTLFKVVIKVKSLGDPPTEMEIN
jgi:hypothetical protein